MSAPALTATYTITAPSSPSNPPPPHPSPISHVLPAALPTLPTPIPSDPLSTKAEVKSIAEPTGLYGPLLAAMSVVREQVNVELTGWKEWEDREFGGVGLGGPKGGNKARKEEDSEDGEEDEEDE